MSDNAFQKYCPGKAAAVGGSIRLPGTSMRHEEKSIDTPDRPC